VPGRSVAGMLAFIKALFSWLDCRFRSRMALEFEVIALRHQLAVLHRKRAGRPRFCTIDRLLWVWLYRVWPRCLDLMVLVKPATVVKWHRQGFRLYWRWRSRSGRKSVDRDTRNLIREMCIANPLWGAPRIHGELLKLGIEISQATVGKYMVRRLRSPSPTWRSFLRNEAIGIAAIDMFIVPSATFRLLFIMLILAHDRRSIVRFDIAQHPTAGWLSRQVTEAFAWDTAPRFLLRDRDASYGSVFSRRVEAMGITEVVTAARSPWQNPYFERVIGSIRRPQRTPFAPSPFILRALLPSQPDASITRQGLSAPKAHPAAAERPNRRPPTSRRVASSLPAPCGLTARTIACHWLRRPASIGPVPCTEGNSSQLRDGVGNSTSGRLSLHRRWAVSGSADLRRTNSLLDEIFSRDTQREACEAFIKSQASEGWRLTRPTTTTAAFRARAWNAPVFSRRNLPRRL
jgi:hypothetical protein